MKNNVPEGKPIARSDKRCGCIVYCSLHDAAPELLEALKTIQERLDGPGQQRIYSDSLHPSDDDKTILDFINEAISKAEGR